MPPVLGPASPSKARLWSCAPPSETTVSPSTRQNRLASSPVRHSSTTTTVSPSPANWASTAASASCTVVATVTPLPAASPSAFTTMGAPWART